VIKIWSFEFWNAQGADPHSYEDEAVVQRAFDKNMGVIENLERIGFEGVFFSEHHFLAALVPCPNLIIAAVAQRTKRLKLGVMGNVLPFHQPFRIAEELAMLDYLCGDRLEIGFASGIAPEYLFVNMPQDQIRPRFTEMLDIMALARDSKIIDYKGEYYECDSLYSMPRRKKSTHRREWMAIYSEGAAFAAARRDMKVACGFQSVDSMVKVFDKYREQMDAEGHPATPDDMAVRRSVVIGESDAHAAELNEQMVQAARHHQQQSFQPVAERMARMTGAAMPQGGADSGVRDAQLASTVPQGGGEKKKVSALDSGLVHFEDEHIHGSAQTVADRIIDQCRRTGAGNLAAYHPASYDYDQLARHYKLWSQVMPLMASARVGAA
jgi:alkanesulfonate monooxygenase SsuD/methylene tetrahydromethanopterin reductase-like flavin-dependent oxidoreductase (luciferase family)